MKRNYTRGESCYNAKLTALAVMEIRNSKDKNASLAAYYGVTEGAIEHVKRGRTWKQVA